MARGIRGARRSSRPGRRSPAPDRADRQRAVRSSLDTALCAGDRPAGVVVRPTAGVVEEGVPRRRRVSAEQPVHVPGDGEALGVLRSDAPRDPRARDLADPAQGATRQSALSTDAERYNAQFDLETIGEQIGYPLFMKPFDGGQWVGVSRVSSPEELRARYDESGERMMHLQTALEDFDVFVRSLSIGAETMSMWFDPSKPMHDRYQVRHDFLTPRSRRRDRQHLPARECLLPLGVQLVRDDREGRRRLPDRLCERVARRRVDVAPLLLPVAIMALVRWSAFCAITRREMLVNQNSRDYFEWGDRGDLSYDEKLAAYRRLADDYLQVEAYEEFCGTHLAHLPEVAHDLVHLRRVRRRPRSDGEGDVPGSRAGSFRRALPWPARGVGRR